MGFLALLPLRNFANFGSQYFHHSIYTSKNIVLGMTQFSMQSRMLGYTVNYRF